MTLQTEGQVVAPVFEEEQKGQYGRSRGRGVGDEVTETLRGQSG